MTPILHPLPQDTDSVLSSTTTKHSDLSLDVDGNVAFLLNEGKVDQTIALLEDVLAASPDHLGTLKLLAVCYERINDKESANYFYSMLTYYHPNDIEGYIGQARLARLRGDFFTAEEKASHALTNTEHVARAFAELGAIAYAQHDYPGAHQRYEQALKLKPDNPGALADLGLVLRALGEIDLAHSNLSRALALSPNSTEALVNFGLVLADMGDYIGAIEYYNNALGQLPDDPDIRLNRAMAYLALEDFEKGWVDYKARLEIAGIPVGDSGLSAWKGQSLETDPLLIRGEQGIGDEIMFASCFSDIARRAKNVRIECNPKLFQLFQRSFSQYSVATYSSIERSSAPHQKQDLRYQIPSGSLPALFRNHASDFPNHAGYLRADPEKIRSWRLRLDQIGEGTKVGIAWQGGAVQTRRTMRSIELGSLAPILGVANCHFISLQHDVRPEHIADFNGGTSNMLHHFADALEDLDETAALVTNLDLVITVQSTIVHLAGALNRPAWVMVSNVPEWRYLASGETMPWYPSVTLFRQPTRENWSLVIDKIVEKLRSHIVSDI